MKSSRTLKSYLRRAGLSDAAVQAAWPTWWTQEAENSLSAQAELRFSIARKLGLSSPALLDDSVDFVWKDQAKFRNIRVEDEDAIGAISSFSVALGATLIGATEVGGTLRSNSALEIRQLVLNIRENVDLHGLLTICWSLGIPVISLKIVPLRVKGMNAVVVRCRERFAILLCRDALYPAYVAFDLAHELGHVCLRHLHNASSYIDVDTAKSTQKEQERDELEADQFGLMLLTGQLEPEIRANAGRFSARQLARAALAAGKVHRIEAGTLALCAGYKTGAWATATSSLKEIYRDPQPVWKEINKVALSQLMLDIIPEDACEYLLKVMDADNV